MRVTVRIQCRCRTKDHRILLRKHPTENVRTLYGMHLTTLHGMVVLVVKVYIPLLRAPEKSISLHS